MARMRRLQPGETIGLKLTVAERDLILERLACLPPECEAVVNATPISQPVLLTLDQLDELSGHVAAEANHADDKKLQKRLDGIFEKIERLLNTHTDQEAAPMASGGSKSGRKVNATRTLTSDMEILAIDPTKTQKTGTNYRLRLTEQQRQSVLQYVELKRGLRQRIEYAPEGTQLVDVTLKEIGQLSDELGRAVADAPGPDKKRLISVLLQVVDLCDGGRADDVRLGDRKVSGRSRAKATGRLLQFKITLLNVQPAIWRRIQIADGTLNDLHEYIQSAFGWENYHLHMFDIDGVRYSQRAPDGNDFDLDFEEETQVILSTLLPKSAKPTRWSYEYDFGDGWRHGVLFEGFLPADPKGKYPVCLEGAPTCPPEDCGGPWGYGDFVQAIVDPQHDRHEELLEWCGPFDPEAFDAKKATKEMRKQRKIAW